MSPDEPNGSSAPTTGDDTAARRALAARWAEALSSTAYLPMSAADVEQYLLDLLDGIVDELAAGTTAGDAAATAGAALIAAHATGQESLHRSVEVLGTGLPALLGAPDPTGVPAAVVTVLGRLAAGYADALRRRTFEQQEAVKQALERVLRLSEARFREVFTASAVGIAITELDGTVARANRSLGDILGYSDTELVGRNLHDLFEQDTRDQLRVAYRDLVNGRVPRFRLERPLVRKDGDTAWVFLSVAALRDEHGAATHHVTMVEDITDLHLLQERLNNQALHDVLTGLPNRQSFALKVEAVLGQLEPSAVITLFQLDVDSFSVINDGLGHGIGDQVLQIVARRLQAVFAGEQALVARVAGDEFAVLVTNSPNTPRVAELADRINDELSEPAYLDDIGLAVTASIGVVQRHAGGIKPAELLRQSDATLRRAKSNGKRQWALFDVREDAAARERFTLAASMPGALENGEFRLTYQPVARLTDGALVAVETLVGWDHSQRGVIGHDEVVRLAEQTGIVLPVGQWALHRACADAAGWHAEFGDAAPVLAVNLAAAQANDPDLVATVREVLDTAGLPPDRLQLGLPVRALLREEGDAEDNLQVLADMGVRTSIHGFGGGHGGLVFLEDLPVQSVWIASWLVRRLADRPDSLAARALADLISLVHAVKATVTVAGVRDDAHAAWWRELGGDLGCGEWFAAAAPADAVTELLRQR